MIYVDNNRIKARVGNLCRTWSHLFAWPPDEQKLIKFAKKLGLKPEWIQKPGTIKAHFDVTENMRRKAISLGATHMNAREYGELLMNEKHFQVLSGKVPIHG